MSSRLKVSRDSQLAFPIDRRCVQPIGTYHCFVFNGFSPLDSLERIEQYMNIEQEPKPTKDGVPAAYWPATGELRVENLSARYSVVRPII